MKNLTKLFCDLISIGSQLTTVSASNEQIGRCVRYTGVTCLPGDCDVDFERVDEHIANCRAAMRGADYDIDSIRERLAQGKPVSIQRIVEFHGKMTVKLNDGSELTFDSSEVTHY